jgi:CRISPR-associated protein Cas2
MKAESFIPHPSAFILCIMRCLLIYDIEDDRVRTKIADACLDYGLDRIQYSAFMGDISRNHQEELFLKVKKLLGKEPGNIQLMPICESDWRNRLVQIRP